MLDNLLEIELAYSMLKNDGPGKVDPFDAHYMKLQCAMEVVSLEISKWWGNYPIRNMRDFPVTVALIEFPILL